MGEVAVSLSLAILRALSLSARLLSSYSRGCNHAGELAQPLFRYSIARLPIAEATRGARRGNTMKAAEEEFDYIVTGAGSAGCAVAARLSESGRYRVLLLEAGGKDRNPWIHIPMGFSRLFADPNVNWMYESEPEAALNGRTMYQPRRQGTGRHQLHQRHGLHARQRGRL
jgi:hypothetical protein